MSTVYSAVVNGGFNHRDRTGVMGVEMGLIDNAIALKARLARLPAKYELPQYRNVVLRLKTVFLGGDGIGYDQIEDRLILPVPYVKQLKPKQVDHYTSDRLDLGINDFEMRVVRSFGIADLTNIEYVVIDPTFDSSKRLAGGKKAYITHIETLTTDDRVLLRLDYDSAKIVGQTPVMGVE